MSYLRANMCLTYLMMSNFSSFGMSSILSEVAEWYRMALVQRN